MTQRAWFGRKRLAKKLNRRYFTDTYYREVLHYLLGSNPGAVVHTCDGCNHRIAKLEVFWEYSPGGNTKIVVEIRVTDELGCWHYFPGGGCVDLPKTSQEICDYVRRWDEPGGWKTIREWKFHRLAEKVRRLREGLEIVDVDGLDLPVYGPFRKDEIRVL